MSAQARIQSLKSEIARGREVMARIERYYEQRARTLTPGPSGTENAIVLSEILTNFYTCTETIFVRISQFFENSLSSRQWHRDLLDKMRLSIEGIRQAVISQDTYDDLGELLRFRHFKRYYFEFNYDWERLDFVRSKFERARSRLPGELDDFVAFLNRLLADDVD